MNIAVWGGTGHVGRALYHAFRRRGADCHCYVRDVEKAGRVLPAGDFSHFDAFPSRKYDILLNGIAAGAVQERFLFETLEQWDWRMIRFAEEHPGCCCVSVSSGAVYGGDFSAPAAGDTAVALRPNHMEGGQIYGLIKLLCEQRHRSFRDLPLVDLRLYAFFTRHMDFEQPFFMSDVMKAIRNGETLVTQAVDFYRDFIHPDDFAEAIFLCAAKKVNAAYDLYSRSPIRKSEILAAFAERYGLRHSCGEVWQSSTGSKSRYYSTYHKAAEVGYAPRFSSLDVLTDEADAIVKDIPPWTSNAR